MITMSTYPGMNLRGEVRECISLDDEDLSDVEDEVFIRDGKNSYKLAEELNAKRPLMAPRRKLGKSNITSKLKKPPCRVFCKPCCYIIAATSVLIGVIALVVILVSIFPLPLDKLRVLFTWKMPKKPPKLLPCSNLNVTDVWTINLPVLSTDSPIKTLDLNNDGIDEIIFGFGVTNNNLPPSVFCPVFLQVQTPCKGGIIALNGITGSVLWQQWLNDSIISLECSQDLNGDNFEDCLATGVEGSLLVVDPRNGSVVWERYSEKIDIYMPNIIPDQNNDSVADLLASFTCLEQNSGFLVLISGNTGEELKRTKLNAKTFFTPQFLQINGTDYVVFGTGSPNTPGNLTAVPFNLLFSENLVNNTVNLYEDRYKGVFTQLLLVDITGDTYLDFIIAMYNSTFLAFDGVNFKQIWNFTVPVSESNVTPIPAYFNDDNITDFLIMYKRKNYTKTFIIDGKTGKAIYDKPISEGISRQEKDGLTLRMDPYGFDFLLFWTEECSGKFEDSDKYISFKNCPNGLNTTGFLKLNGLNQYDQPPGFPVFNSVNQSVHQLKSPISQYKKYLKTHPEQGQSEISDNYNLNKGNIKIHKYGSSSFRHKDNREEVKDYVNNNNPGEDQIEDYDPGNNDFNNYNLEDSLDLPNFFDDFNKENNRGIRSKNEKKTRKKNLSDDNIYDYKNVKRAQDRLLHDLNDSPTEILKDSYVKNRLSSLNKSRFEQRDLNSHKINEYEKMLRQLPNKNSFTLWDLESEKEEKDKESGDWRYKREINSGFVPKITSSTGVIQTSFNATDTVDIVFIVYWQPIKDQNIDSLIQKQLEDCIHNKLVKSKARQKTETQQKNLFMRQCLNEQTMKQDIPYYNDIMRLNLGQLTIYRKRIQCSCQVVNKDEKCASFRVKKQKKPI